GWLLDQVEAQRAAEVRWLAVVVERADRQIARGLHGRRAGVGGERRAVLLVLLIGRAGLVGGHERDAQRRRALGARLAARGHGRGRGLAVVSGDRVGLVAGNARARRDRGRPAWLDLDVDRRRGALCEVAELACDDLRGDAAASLRGRRRDEERERGEV